MVPEYVVGDRVNVGNRVNMAVWLRLIVAVLAVWRLTHLLTREEGPWRIFARTARTLGDGIVWSTGRLFQVRQRLDGRSICPVRCG